MPDGLTVDVDASAVLAMLDRLGERAQPTLNEVAQETAQLVAREARARVARRTGRTAEKITVEAIPWGSRVYVQIPSNRYPTKWPIHLEYGTRFMTARPFLVPSARLEEGPHLRRVEAALQDLLDDVNRG